MEMARWVMALCLFGCLQSQAQTNTTTIPPDRIKMRADFIEKYRPLRIIKGQLYDFTAIFAADIEGSGDSGFDGYILKGTVRQIMRDGILVQKGDKMVRLLNYRYESKAIDGDKIGATSIRSGRYQYPDGDTIAEYDCGKPVLSQPKQTRKNLVRRNDEPLQMDIPELDLLALKELESR